MSRSPRRRRPARSLRICVTAWIFVACLHAQRAHDPLTPQEEDQVREVADQPNERVKLYMQFIERRTETIRQETHRATTQHPGQDIHDAMEEFTRLVDELQENLDVYGEQHLDARKGLKTLLEQAPKWTDTLNLPPASPQYDFARKSALDAITETRGSAADLLKEQEQYFGKHKAPKH